MEQTNPNLEEGEASLQTSAELEEQLERAAQCIRSNETFLVASHHEPDGDAIASTLALASILEDFGKSVVRFNVDPVPYYCEFLEGSERVTDELPRGWSPDVTVLLDCSSHDRVGWESAEIPETGGTLIIDHHRTIDRESGDLYVHDEDAAATGALVYRLGEELGATWSRPIGECIYAALMMDTGSFQYSNTSGSTFRIAGALLDCGVDPWKMTMHLLESQPRRRVELLADVLDTLSLSADGRVAFIRIDRDMIDDDERVAQLTDGFINYGRSIRGVEVSVQLRERPDGTWRVSFRSKGRVDVSAIASAFGGGGHANAAGCEIDASPTEIRERLTATVVDLLEEER